MAQTTQNPVPNAPSTQTASPAPTPNESTTSTVSVPFELFLKRSMNPLDFYRGKSVPPVNMANSPRLNSFVKDGKIYLTLRDAIDLALEDNLDMVIARYNLPIAQLDVLRGAAGAYPRGVNTGVVSGTPGGASTSGGGGAGAGGTSLGAGGAGAGNGGIVTSTLGGGSSVSNFDPYITVQTDVDHLTQAVNNQVLYGVPVVHDNTVAANFTYNQAFPTGGYIQAVWNNNRQTFNSPNYAYNPQFFSFGEIYASQPLLAGFGFGPNLRYLRIARTNKKVSDIAFRAQVIATVTQICNIYWDLVAAYDTAQVNQRSVDFANETLDKSRKQLELQAIPQTDVLKAESDLATRKQELTVASTTLEQQELYMKNAITRSLDDPVLEDMPVVPVDHIVTDTAIPSESIPDMIADALKNRPDVQEQELNLQNSELSRKTERNNLLPSLSVYGYLSGTGYSGPLTSTAPAGTITSSNGYGGAALNAFNYSSPEYQVGFQLGIPLRNRVAKADQYRTELEYRQSQVGLEEKKKSVRIEVRSARFALEQGTSRVDAAREARDLAAKMLDIAQKQQQLGSGSNQQTLSAEHDLAVAENALVTAETDFAKARVQMLYVTGTTLQNYGISIEQAKSANGASAPIAPASPTAPSPTGQ
ncbi:TolC family protein [Acidicapsa dinghuensis]|uniref:TolC family protein n=1 Tax=Acidicapsa dinghuensis TaxID=2218256 RepID=A0ABW1EG18_9BACT|nr:TolC family protein [Acidicapsa dinghuensis]